VRFERFYQGNTRLFYDEPLQQQRYETCLLANRSMHTITLPEDLPALVKMANEVNRRCYAQIAMVDEDDSSPDWSSVLDLIIARIILRYGNSSEGRRALRSLIMADDVLASTVFEQIALMERLELVDWCIDLAFVSRSTDEIVGYAIEALVNLGADLRPFRPLLHRFVRQNALYSPMAAQALCQMNDMRGWNYLVQGLFSTDEWRFASSSNSLCELHHRIIPPRWVVNRILHWIRCLPHAIPPKLRMDSFEVFIVKKIVRFILQYPLDFPQKVSLLLVLQQRIAQKPDAYHPAFRMLAHDVLIWARASRYPYQLWRQLEWPPAIRPYIHPSNAPVAGLLRMLVQEYKGVDIFEEIRTWKPQS